MKEQAKNAPSVKEQAEQAKNKMQNSMNSAGPAAPAARTSCASRPAPREYYSMGVRFGIGGA